jgi:hypothetical protein
LSGGEELGLLNEQKLMRTRHIERTDLGKNLKEKQRLVKKEGM